VIRLCEVVIGRSGKGGPDLPVRVGRSVVSALVSGALAHAAMELFFALLQKNVLDRHRWDTRDELRLAIIMRRRASRSVALAQVVVWPARRAAMSRIMAILIMASEQVVSRS
jgi:hypothetical protein